MAKKGKAYGFFYCGAAKKTIESELPMLRKEARTPSNLELSLIEGTENLKGDSNLTALAKEANKDGMNYVLEAAYENATNEDTADRLIDLFNQTYQSPLYGDKETFSGAVVYRKNSKYIFRE